MKPHILIFSSALLLAHVAAHAGQMISTTDDKDKKLITPVQTALGGFYASVFGGANLSQSGDPKQINVSEARPRTSGTAAQIATFKAAELAGSEEGFFAPAKPVPLPAGAKVTSPTFTTDYDGAKTGEFTGLKFGYEFSTPCIVKPSLEIEGFYSNLATSGSVKSNGVITGLRDFDDDGDELTEPFLNPDSIVAPTRAIAHFTDNVQSGVFMINNIIHFDLGRFRPYIGGGIGLAYVSHSYSTSILQITKLDYKASPIYGQVQLLPVNHSPGAISDAPPGVFAFGSDSEVTFAWQAIGGIDYSVTKQISVFAEYRALFFLDGPYYRSQLSNMVDGGVKFNF